MAQGTIKALHADPSISAQEYAKNNSHEFPVALNAPRNLRRRSGKNATDFDMLSAPYNGPREEAECVAAFEKLGFKPEEIYRQGEYPAAGTIASIAEKKQTTVSAVSLFAEAVTKKPSANAAITIVPKHELPPSLMNNNPWIGVALKCLAAMSVMSHFMPECIHDETATANISDSIKDAQEAFYAACMPSVKQAA
jgi:hypothetical protein